jgi:hypothetical protein
MALRDMEDGMLRWFVEDLATVAALMLVVAMIATWA